MISVPVPATSEIFAASNAITRQIDVDTELVTPTGAAIINVGFHDYNFVFFLISPRDTFKTFGITKSFVPVPQPTF